MDNFKCKAETMRYCARWLRECVSWNNCSLNAYGSPCPGCLYASPLNREECQQCEHFDWKKENYQE